MLAQQNPKKGEWGIVSFQSRNKAVGFVHVDKFAFSGFWILPTSRHHTGLRVVTLAAVCQDCKGQSWRFSVVLNGEDEGDGCVLHLELMSVM